MSWRKKHFGEPVIDGEKTFVSNNATIIGVVEIGDGVYIAPNVSIRADEGTPFKICDGTNVQDGVLIHGLIHKKVLVDHERFSVFIGKECAIAHHAIVHGPTSIGNNVFVGFRSTVHNSQIGDNCFIGHHALVSGVKVPDGKRVPDGTILNSQEMVKNLPCANAEDHEFCSEVVQFNKGIVPKYIERRKEKDWEEVNSNKKIRAI